MKKYMNPQMEILRFTAEDMIVTSSAGGGQGGPVDQGIELPMIPCD